MRTRMKTKIWLVIATTLVLFGCILFAGVMSKLNWDFTKLSTVEYETNAYEISETFDSISINTDTSDIVFAVSDSENCKVECYEETSGHLIVVEDNTLVIKTIDSKPWYECIGLNIDFPKMTIYLPAREYGSLLIHEDTGDVEVPKAFTFRDVDISSSTGDVTFCASAFEMLKIKTSTGNVCVENIFAGLLDISASTGKVTVSGVSCKGDITVAVLTAKAYLSDTRCKSFISSGSTGDISLNNVVATEKFSIERSTGDVQFEDSDAAEIFIKTDTGYVTGSLISDKIFITQTNTGDVDVPKSANGDICEIITDTGDIKITIKQ